MATSALSSHVPRRAPAGGAPALARRLLAVLAEHRAGALTALALGAILAGGGLWLAGGGGAATLVWRAAVAALAAELAFEVVRTVVVHRHLGVDTVAFVAMVGALALGEELAGAVVGLMFAGGTALEAAAARRARRELTGLARRAPAIARRRVGDAIEEVPAAEVAAGDILVVGTGEVVPADGALESERAVLDTSALTGEPLPVTRGRGEPVLSGWANAGPALELRAERPAGDSAYARLLRLVERAQAQRAPLVRLADRYAGVFLPTTLALAALAWALSGDPVRALAVVVVATPCPLILAAPIALVSGVSRAARAGVIVKGAPAIETLGRARTVILDKTGTLTPGSPDVVGLQCRGPMAPLEMLRLAASLDRLSPHPLAGGLVRAAAREGVELAPPSAVAERPGQGIAGVVDGRRVAVGSWAFLRAGGHVGADDRAGAGPASGEAQVLVAVDGRLAGTIAMADRLRPDAARTVERLRAAGIRHVAIASGDRAEPAERAGRRLAVDRVYAEQEPADKLELVRRLRRDPELAPVVMVGDGVNDAPALALADLGIAMGGAGLTVSAETSDAVIAVDRIDRVADAVSIGRRSLTIARQSMIAGMALSVVAMLVAAAGYLPPVAGAVLQEGVDLAVIGNALRALRP